MLLTARHQCRQVDFPVAVIGTQALMDNRKVEDLMRSVIIPISVALSLVVMSGNALSKGCEVGDVSFDGIPTPQAAPADLKPEYAAFVGTWKCGNWGSLLANGLVVTEVGDNGSAKAWYAWGTYQRAGIYPGHAQVDATIKNGILSFQYVGATFFYEVEGDKTLKAYTDRAGRSRLHGTLQKTEIAAASSTPAASGTGTVSLNSLIVEKNLKTGSYPVTLAFDMTGTPTIRRVCFRWSGEGPFCWASFKINKQKGHIETRATTRNAGRYVLSGFVEYMTGGSVTLSNEVTANIRVKN